MGIFDFFKKKRKSVKAGASSAAGEDQSQWTGKNFEFLITGDVEIPHKDFDRKMTPNKPPSHSSPSGNSIELLISPGYSSI